MVYTGLVFVGYIAALCLALIGVSLAILVIMKNRKDNTELFKSVRTFSVLILLVAVLYFYFFFREKLMENYWVDSFWRIIDYVLCASVLFSWIDIETKLLGKKNRVGIILAGLQAAVGCVVTAVFSDGYYTIDNERISLFFSVFEIMITVAFVITVIRYVLEFIQNEIDMQKRVFATANSILVLIWNINQTFIDTGLYEGKFGESAWSHHAFDPASVLMLLMAFFTLMFMFREDFSPLYFMTETAEEKKDILGIIAEENQLSVRECETLRLIYDGYSNLEIADDLCISVSTVKKHARSIYTKMGVTGRMDLMMFIKDKSENM